MRQERELQGLQGHQATHVLLERDHFMSGLSKQANKTMNSRQDKPAGDKQDFGISKECYHLLSRSTQWQKGAASTHLLPSRSTQ